MAKMTNLEIAESLKEKQICYVCGKPVGRRISRITGCIELVGTRLPGGKVRHIRCEPGSRRFMKNKDLALIYVRIMGFNTLVEYKQWVNEKTINDGSSFVPFDLDVVERVKSEKSIAMPIIRRRRRRENVSVDVQPIVRRRRKRK